jgi:hypothetical protein
MILSAFSRKVSQYLSYKSKLHNFQSRANPLTWELHDRFLDVAHRESSSAISSAIESSPIVQKGEALRRQSLKFWGRKYSEYSRLRILVHVPSQSKSPAGFSLFSNIIECLKFMGVPCCPLYFHSDTQQILNDFKPNIFISSDNKLFIENIDWSLLSRYRSQFELKIGLTAYIEEYGFSSPLIDRLNWGARIGIDFYYSFRSPEYLHSRLEYKPFYDYHSSIFSIEFGFNPIWYFPTNCYSFKIPYVFLASSNIDKQDRYQDWLLPIARTFPGFIDGPGWTKNSSIAPKNIHNNLYSRSKVGINLHIDMSIDYPSELNERTYILAACGVPQLIDNPMLLSDRFSTNAYYSASNPLEYFDLFCYMLENTAETQSKSLNALDQVYSKHTYFHRLDNFVKYLETLLS